MLTVRANLSYLNTITSHQDEPFQYELKQFQILTVNDSILCVKNHFISQIPLLAS